MTIDYFSRRGFGAGNVNPTVAAYRSVTGNDSTYLCIRNLASVGVLRFRDSSNTVSQILPEDMSRGVTATDMLESGDTIVVVADSFKVITDGSVSRPSYRYVVFTTLDGGSTWNKDAAPEWDSRLQWISRSDDGEIIVAGGEIAYRLDVSRQVLTPIICNELVYVTSVVTKRDIMVAVGDKLCRSSNRGVTWSELTTPFTASNVRRLVRVGDERVIGFETSFRSGQGGELSIWISDDLGLSWTRSGQFKSAAKIDPFDFDVIHPGHVVAAGQSAMVHYSTDSGSTWRVDGPPLEPIKNLYGVHWIDSATIRVCGDNESVYVGVIDVESSVDAPAEAHADAPILYPNPARFSFTAQVAGRTIASVEVYDMELRRVYSAAHVDTSTARIDVSHLPVGSYVVVLLHDAGVASATLVKE
jgi:photosystem II stability/assembly factor-like uncharacterized protein